MQARQISVNLARSKQQEEEKDQAEIIHEKVLCIGAKDDVLWDTFRFSGIHAEDHAFGGR